MTGIWRLRAAVLTLVGALAVHQARYLIAPRGPDHELAGAHGYLGWLMPVAAALLFLATVQLAASVRRARGGRGPALPSTRLLWAASSGTLLAVFGLQETIELTVVHGHLPEAVELLAHGGWQVAVLALAVGGGLALMLRGAARVVALLLRRRRAEPRRARPPLARTRAVLSVPRGSVLARKLAGRAPPSTSW